ncbi:MAG: tetratricopeptide repeat protein, partial [Pseudomonadota bacterium]
MIRRATRLRGSACAIALVTSILAAATTIPAASAENQGSLSGAYLAAESAAKRGDIAAAADYYARAVAGDPQNEVLLERAVLHQIAAGRIESAVAMARKLIEMKADSQIALLQLTAEAFSRDDPATILQMIADRGDATGPFVGHLIEAWASYATGDTDGARAALIALRDDGTGGAAGEMLSTYHLGMLNAALGDDATAVEGFVATTERAGAPTNRLVRAHAGSLARSGDVPGAIALIDEQLTRTRDGEQLRAMREELEAGQLPGPLVTTGAEGAAEALFGISGFLTRGQNSIIGLAYSRLATYLNPDLTDAKLLMAQMLRRDGQYQLAIAAYESVPRNSPEALQAQIGRAESMQDAGKVEPGIIAMREVLARFPRSVEAHEALGNMLRR